MSDLESWNIEEIKRDKRSGSWPFRAKAGVYKACNESIKTRTACMDDPTECDCYREGRITWRTNKLNYGYEYE